MLKHAILAVTATTLLSAPAHADWEYTSGEDALDDTKFAVIAQTTPDNQYGVMVKCYEGKPDDTFMIFMTSEAFDESATYAESVPVLIRFDKGEKLEIKVRPRNMEGKFALETSTDMTPRLLDHVVSIGEAKKQMVFGVFNMALIFPATGSGKAVDQFKATCKLP